MAGWRGIVSVTLLLIGGLAVPFATVAVWLHSVVFDTDTCVNTIAPLGTNQAVTDAAADHATTQLFTRVDVEEALRQRLPVGMQFLAAPLAEDLRGFVRSRAREATSSDEFAQLRTEVNRAVHPRIIRFLEGDTEVIILREGQVTVDLQRVVDWTKARLDAAGIDIFNNLAAGEGGREYVIFESPALAKVQRALVVLNQLAIALPVVAVVAPGAALVVSQRRLHTMLQIGVGATLATGLLLAALAIARHLYINGAAERGLSVPAATAVWDTLLGGLWSIAWVLLGIGMVIAVLDWLAGQLRRA